MSLTLFLNELSCESESGRREVDTAMAGFVDTLRHLKSWQSIALVTRSPLPTSELARGYLYQQWVNSSEQNRDRHRYLLALRSRSPFRDAVQLTLDPDEVEYRHDNRTVEGIAFAHLTDGLAVSLPVSAKWATSWLDIDIQHLTEDGIESSRDRARHCSSPNEADEHRAWAQDTASSSLITLAEILDAWDEFFPHLQKIPRFERGLRRLDVKWHRPVRKLLIDLEATAANWDPATSPEPQWQHPHITPESQSRQQLCTFTDLDGEDRCFSWHGRFTPGAGRLHFRLVPEEPAFRLGHVGDKLGSDAQS
ncbi:hypothetical protein GCM10010441_00550 [Kitasatospora paracochleata]|uniref:Uncharacterized protein n=1 Tax=Kitasatospora paracochleata TaxID=58354 RepID=A0ABT1J636_9ACTN|nr:hypothetical protein [Kitasatospora paracochleata]MCP2312694.1 hypothetical protein [Kitasatospora paracochleata]